MRIYLNFKQALNEIKRDLGEMGVKIHTTSYQNKDISDDPRFETLELQNYMYTVVKPNLGDLNPTQPWADQEFAERVSTDYQNPGLAWKERKEVWEEFLNLEGKFDYSYNERMALGIETLIDNLKKDPLSRQHYLSIWNPKDIHFALGKRRIPCSLGYLFQVREGKLDITYLMRSSDFVTHLNNDLYLATKLLFYITNHVKIEPGKFTHWMGSLHIFKKDVEGVF